MQYAHNSFANVYERDRWFDIRNGELIGELVVVNPPPPLLYRINDRGNRQYVLDFAMTEPVEDPLEGRPLTDAYLVWGRKPEEQEPENG